jgi:hypothetical protein
MTSVLNVDTIADKAGTGPVGLTKQTASKARFTVNQANNTIALSSFNISSLADTATGRTTYNLTNSFSSANEHCTIGIGTDADNFYDYTIASHAAGSAQFIQGASAHDIDFASVIADGDLA